MSALEISVVVSILQAASLTSPAHCSELALRILKALEAVRIEQPPLPFRGMR
jgi:hypothetical protein